MKPAAFDYHRPQDLGEALALLGDLGDDAKLLAGGQSLVPMMNFRLAVPAALVDLNRVDALAGIRPEDGSLVVGALTRQWDLETSQLARERCPVLPDALGLVGHVATRTRGTVGGSLAHGDASAELPIVAVALGAELVVAAGKPENRRTVAADDFFRFYLTTALEPADVLVEVRFPAAGRGRGSAFEEFALRHGDFLLAAAGASLELDDGGGCRGARIALGGVGPTPVRAPRAEAILAGSPFTEESVREAGNAAAAEIDPPDDPQAPVGYRRDLVRALTTRALARAGERARASWER